MGDAWLNFNGVVTDAAGNPVQGAEITVLINGETPDHAMPVLTHADGSYSYHADSCPCNFEFTLKAEKEGYRSYTVTMEGLKANMMRRYDIMLQQK